MIMRMLVSVGLLLVPAAAHAQMIQGLVMEDGTEETITGAQVDLVGPDGRSLAGARTDGRGFFLLRIGRAGTYTIRLTHLSYAAVESDTVTVGAHESVSVELRMSRAALPLEPLVVTARADIRRATGFDERMNRPGAAGHFVTRQQVDRRRGVRATELLDRIPGVDLRPVTCGMTLCGNVILMRGMGVTVQRAGEMDFTHTVTDQCEPTVYVNGQVVAQSGDGTGTLDTFLTPANVEGVEVYTRGSTAPPPILARSACGVVAFWTRDDGYARFSWRKLGAWFGGMAFVYSLTRF